MSPKRLNRILKTSASRAILAPMNNQTPIHWTVAYNDDLSFKLLNYDELPDVLRPSYKQYESFKFIRVSCPNIYQSFDYYHPVKPDDDLSHDAMTDILDEKIREGFAEVKEKYSYSD
jgi:hypothetical protein